MARKKINKFTGTFQIFFSSIKTYFLYLDQIAKYLAFPVFGQLLGIILIFTVTYYFRTQFYNYINLSVFYVILIPFLLIFLKAFYNYLVAFASLNLLFYTVSGKSKVKKIDFKANDNVIIRKMPNYIVLLFLLSVIGIIISIPPLLFISPFIWLFLCLCIQVFALEGDVSPIKAISRSVELVKNNILSTVIMIILCYIVTYWFLPNLFIWAFEKLSLVSALITPYEQFFELVPLDNINSYLSLANYSIDPLTIAKFAAEYTISFIIISFTLPFRCCCFTELYRNFDSNKIKEFSKETDEIITRATGKKRKN